MCTAIPVQKGRFTNFAFTYGDSQDGGDWWRDIAAGTSCSYTSSTGVITTITWCEFHQATCGAYVGDAHYHGKACFSKGGNGYKLSKTNAFLSWKVAMMDHYPACKTENIDMYFQHIVNMAGYDKYTGMKAKKRTHEEKLDESRDFLKSKSLPLNPENMKFALSVQGLSDYKSTSMLIDPYVIKQEHDDVLMSLPDVADQQTVINHSRNFVRGWLERIFRSQIHGLKGYQQDDKRLAVFAHTILINTFRRREGDGVKALFLMGKSGIGKTTTFFNNKLIHKVPTDAEGVGRYSVTINQNTMLYEEWSVEKLFEPDNVNLFKQLALGQRASIKVHGKVNKLEPMWVAMTTNTDLDCMEQLITTRDPNEASAIRRRILSVHWPSEVESKSNTDIQFKDSAYCTSLMILHLIEKLAADPGSKLLDCPYTPYIRQLYETRYDDAYTWYVGAIGKRDRVTVVFPTGVAASDLCVDPDIDSLVGFTL